MFQVTWEAKQPETNYKAAKIQKQTQKWCARSLETNQQPLNKDPISVRHLK